jgi:hypothetical protein
MHYLHKTNLTLRFLPILGLKYVGQPDDHIVQIDALRCEGFASIYPTDPRTNPAQFREKILRIDGFEKRPFLSRPFLHNPMKSSQRFLGSKDGSKF